MKWTVQFHRSSRSKMGANSKKTPITIGIVPVSALSAECRIESILSKNFLLLPQNFATNQRPHSKFPHPTPRVAYQCPYAKEIRWIGPKMTELEPFSWRRSKFLKTSLSRRIAIFDVLAEILISTVRAQFWADWPQFFFLLLNNYLYFRVVPCFTLKP